MQPFHALLVVVVILTGCASSAGEAITEAVAAPRAAPTSSPIAELTVEPDDTTAPVARESVVVPLTLHLAVEAGASTSELSSQRTLEDLQIIAENMREIWAQAGVILDPVNVHQLEMPPDVLRGILLGDTSPFFAQVNATFVPESSQAINGFYVRGAFGVNGFTPQGSNIFFVVDEPSVPDERVSSHEVGHIFGLHHDLVDPRQLMFSGTAGTGLSELEQTVARYGAVGIFPQDATP